MSWTLDRPCSPSRAILLGLALAAPGALFLTANVLNDVGVGLLYAPVDAVLSSARTRAWFNVVSPVVFLGGPALALLLNLLAIGRWDVQWENRQFVSRVAIAPEPANVAVILGGALVLSAFLAYGVVENYAIIRTHV